VTVDESGTVASAATALIATRLKPKQFHVNRDFIFLIYNSNLRITLFSGIVKDPRI